MISKSQFIIFSALLASNGLATVTKEADSSLPAGVLEAGVSALVESGAISVESDGKVQLNSPDKQEELLKVNVVAAAEAPSTVSQVKKLSKEEAGKKAKSLAEALFKNDAEKLKEAEKKFNIYLSMPARLETLTETVKSIKEKSDKAKTDENSDKVEESDKAKSENNSDKVEESEKAKTDENSDRVEESEKAKTVENSDKVEKSEKAKTDENSAEEDKPAGENNKSETTPSTVPATSTPAAPAASRRLAVSDASGNVAPVDQVIVESAENIKAMVSSLHAKYGDLSVLKSAEFDGFKADVDTVNGELSQVEAVIKMKADNATKESELKKAKKTALGLGLGLGLGIPVLTAVVFTVLVKTNRLLLNFSSSTASSVV